MERCFKIGYRSEREAREILNLVGSHRFDRKTGNRLNKRIGKKEKQPKRAYKCEDCQQWHLTSDERPKSKFTKK